MKRLGNETVFAVDYNVLASWRNVPQGNVSLARNLLTDDGDEMDLDPSLFDLNDDRSVDNVNRDTWFAKAGPRNGFGGAYLVDDANLDGSVDAQDLNAVGLTWQTANNNWTDGNFIGGNTDAADLNGIGLSWQQSVGPAAVPEPSTMSLVLPCVLFVLSVRRDAST